MKEKILRETIIKVNRLVIEKRFKKEKNDLKLQNTRNRNRLFTSVRYCESRVF